MEKQRRQNYTCFRRGGSPDEAIRRLKDQQQHPNLLARYDYAGACPRTMLQAVPVGFLDSIPWYDKGALGIPYHKVPGWYRESVIIFENARSRAHDQWSVELKSNSGRK